MRTFILVFLSACAMIGLSLAMNYKYQYYPVPYLVQPPRTGGFDGSFIGIFIIIFALLFIRPGGMFGGGINSNGMNMVNMANNSGPVVVG